MGFDLEDHLEELSSRFPNNDHIKLYVAISTKNENKSTKLFHRLLKRYNDSDLLHLEFAKKLLAYKNRD
jgi:predicted Zn-dependent protease